MQFYNLYLFSGNTQQINKHATKKKKPLNLLEDAMRKSIFCSSIIILRIYFCLFYTYIFMVLQVCVNLCHLLTSPVLKVYTMLIPFPIIFLCPSCCMVVHKFPSVMKWKWWLYSQQEVHIFMFLFSSLNVFGPINSQGVSLLGGIACWSMYNLAGGGWMAHTFTSDLKAVGHTFI